MTFPDRHELGCAHREQKRSRQVTQFLYFYGVGGIIFLTGLIYCARAGIVGLRQARARRNLALLVGGYFYFVLIHAFFQFVTPSLHLGG